MAMVVEKECYFLPLTEADKVLDCPNIRDLLKEIPNVEVFELPNEHGRLETGILIAGESPMKRVRLEWRVQTSLKKTLLQAGNVIRSNQGRDMQLWWNDDVISHRPKSFKAPLSVEALKAKVVDYKKAKEEKDAEPPSAELAGLPAATAMQEAEVVEESETDSDDQANIMELMLPSAVAASAKTDKNRRKGAGKGANSKGRGKKKMPLTPVVWRPSGARTSAESRDSLLRPTAPPSNVSVAGHAESEAGGVRAAGSARSRSPSARTSASALKSPTEKIRHQINKYLGELSLSKIVIGSKVGNELSHAQRALSCARREPEEFAEEIVAMDSHLKRCALASSIDVKNMVKLPLSKRHEILEKLVPRMEDLPWVWTASLLCLHVRDLPMQSPKHIKTFIDCVSPLPLEGHRDLPMMCSHFVLKD